MTGQWPHWIHCWAKTLAWKQPFSANPAPDIHITANFMRDGRWDDSEGTKSAIDSCPMGAAKRKAFSGAAGRPLGRRLDAGRSGDSIHPVKLQRCPAGCATRRASRLAPQAFVSWKV
jgi:hypothetical protein